MYFRVLGFNHLLFNIWMCVQSYKLHCIQLLKSKFFTFLIPYGGLSTEFISEKNSLMSAFVTDNSLYFSIICYLWVHDCPIGISAMHLMFLQEPSMSTFHFSPGFWDLEVSKSLLDGLSNTPVLKSISIDMWVYWWLGILLMFTLWFFSGSGAEKSLNLW